MSFPIRLTFANPPPGTCPSTFDEAVVLLQALLSGEVTTTFIPYILGFATPAVEDQDKAWIRLDANGRPLGTFIFYAGSWRRQYTGKPGQIAMFNGNPATYFDGTGKGLITAEWDGWAICNGNNGTPNLTDKFIAGAHMDNSDGQLGYTGGVWKSMVYPFANVATGGVPYHTIVASDLPALDISIDGNEYNPGGSPHADARVIIDLLYANGAPHSADIAHYGTTGAQTSIPSVPPFYAMAFALFIGYS